MRDWHIVSAFRLIADGVSDFNISKMAATVGVGLWSTFAPTHATLIIGCSLIVIVIVDFVTGIRVALRRKRFLRSRLWNRIIDKGVAYLALFAISLAVRGLVSVYPGAAQLVGVGSDVILALATIGELVSVLENLDALGVPYVGTLAKLMRIRVDQNPEPQAETEQH